MLTIEATPPERLSATRQVIPQDIYDRTVDVIVHYARPILLERDVIINLDTPLLPSLTWSHLELLEIWHQASAQLIADGVPHQHILTGGELCIDRILRRFAKRLVEPNPWLPWKYSPSKRKPSAVFNFGETSSIDSEAVFESTQDVDSGDESDEEVTDSYEWPSEDGRYEAMATAHKEQVSAGKHKGQQAPNVLKIPVMRPAPCEMAQNRTSTLRTLTTFMRDTHEKTFDAAIGAYDRDEDFWESLYLDLNHSWGSYSETVELRVRFEWVLELIRTGELSSEAQTAFDIVVEVLTGSSPSSQKHPYSEETDCDVAGLIGPDLSREWAKTFFKINNVLQTVKSAITNRMPTFGIDGFCFRYGLLIIRAWENAMAQGGHLPNLKDVRCDDEARPSMELYEPQTANGSSEVSTSSMSSRPALSLQIPEAVAGSSYPPPPPSPDPYPPLPGNVLTGRIRDWHEDEIDYAIYLSKLNHLTVAEKVAKFHLKFHSNHRTKEAIELRMSRLKLKKVKEQGGQAREKRPWNDAEHDLLLTLLQTCNTWDEVTAAMEAEFPRGRTKAMIKAYAERNSLDFSRISKAWDNVQHKFLVNLLRTCDSWGEVTAAMEAKFHTGRSKAAIQTYAYKRELDVSRLSKAIEWTTTHKKFIKELHARQTKPTEYPRLLKEEFGIEVSVNACTHMRSKLGLIKRRGKNNWSPEELEFLATNSHLEPSDFYRKYVQKFGQKRNRSAVLQKLKKLKDGKNTTLYHQNRRWTAEQDELLLSVAHLTRKEKYAAYYAKFGRTRSKAALLKRLSKLRKRANKL